jgi:hypothetical protein
MKDLEWLHILGSAGAVLVVLALLFGPVSASVRFISKVGSVKKAATIYYRTLKVARPTLGKRALQNVRAVVGGIVSACSYASRNEIEPTTTRLLFRGEIVLMLILGASCAVLAVAGVVGLVTGGGDSLRESLMDLVMACVGAFWCKVVWRDIHRQRRRFADPRYS